MKNSVKWIAVLLGLILSIGCSNDDSTRVTNPIPIVIQPIPTPIPTPTPAPNPSTKSFRYLALGDSYTIGQSVCETCRFPEQLKASLQTRSPKDAFSLKIIAQTGWTTTNLLSVINGNSLESNYDLVTLLIGVNNQYQNRPFALYEKEFPELVTKAIALAKGDKTNVIVVSIPDYAYTPFGEQTGNQSKISTEIDAYNAFAEKYCLENAIVYVYITDITRTGLQNPSFVATDGLHPSELAYAQFVSRIMPKAVVALEN
ncbi:SGNH/GDSL hydrolase family protein [Flavobacterium restrictum]|uniref:SGNH/GDSL hydrolase family protein n=1 Tax=Flavobacterium restrictum TaxID=2594428 RepID=A0A553DUN1_9FLAO|nr:SGNH/GDSL hydrolase family protein [Flavobacterium restrictum]TRX36343.1 SGNH/GDSL hydrolase family protein [Flavobacterium restrictum]